MRTQIDNPVYRSLSGRFLAPNGKYPAEHVNIFWNESANRAVRDVEVVFIPRGGYIPTRGEGEKLWADFGDYCLKWNKDLGNACEGWLEPHGLMPAQIFGHMLRIGFASQDAMIQALEEFARIDGTVWAHDMLSAFRDEEEID